MIRAFRIGLVLSCLLSASRVRAENANVNRPRSSSTQFHADGSTDVVELGGGARVFAHPGASGSVQKPCWMPPESGTKALRAALVLVREGRLTVESPADGSRPVVIKSGRQTMLLWRGSAHVVVVRGGSIRVALDDGAAYAGAHEGWIRVPKEAVVSIERNAAPNASHGRLAAPEIPSCAEGSLRVITDDTAPTRVCWKRRDDANGYRIEIATDEAMHDIVAVVDAGAEQSSTNVPLPAGRYHARVLAFGPDGTPVFLRGHRPFASCVQRCHRALSWRRMELSFFRTVAASVSTKPASPR